MGQAPGETQLSVSSLAGRGPAGLNASFWIRTHQLCEVGPLTPVCRTASPPRTQRDTNATGPANAPMASNDKRISLVDKVVSTLVTGLARTLRLAR